MSQNLSNKCNDQKYYLLSMDPQDFYEKLDNNDQELIKWLKKLGNGLIETGIKYYEQQHQLYQKQSENQQKLKKSFIQQDIQNVMNAKMLQSPKNSNNFYQIFGDPEQQEKIQQNSTLNVQQL